MNKPNFSKFIKDVAGGISRHSPEILTGIGIAGWATATVLAVSATPKALLLIEEKKEEEQVEKLAPVEVIKTTWKCYIPAVVTGVASTACIIGASKVNMRRNAALATAYKLSETALTEYREKVIETIGEQKEKTVREKVVEDRMEKNPVTKNEIIVTAKGNTLFYDALFGRWFEYDIDMIDRAVNKLNRVLLREDYVSVNDFYDELEIGHIEIGDDLGWSIDDVGKDGIDIVKSPHLAPNGQPCIAITYSVAPKRGYYSYL